MTALLWRLVAWLIRAPGVSRPRRHRCGGVLIPKPVEIPETHPPIIMAGVVCDRCGEELVTASSVIDFEAAHVGYVAMACSRARGR